MPYARKVDLAHREISQQLRELGFSVFDLSATGKGFPDILIGKNGIDAKVELKTQRSFTTKSKQKAQDRLSQGQRTFAEGWRGSPVIVAFTLQDVLFAFNLQMKLHGWSK